MGRSDPTVLPARQPQWRRPRRGDRAGSAGPGPLAPVLELQRMAGNRAVTALVARDPKTTPPPGKAPEKKKDLPKHNYVIVDGMDPIPFESAQLGSGGRLGTAGHGANREAPSSTVLEVAITTLLGDHSNDLFQKSVWGKPFTAEVVFVKPDGTPYLKIKLTNALISSYSVSGHGGGPDTRPMESWVLNADKIEYETAGDTKPNAGG